jgi:hypothetical protein
MSMVMPPAFMHSAAGPGAGELEASGGTLGFLTRLAGSEIALGEMSPEARAGFIISLDELAEGEALEAEWREAEEIAAIADGELTQVPGFQAFRRKILESRD